MEHFSHEHPLVLWDEVKDEEKEYVCDGCHQTISSPYYHCNQCKFFLHKSCTDRPREILHPIHPEHQLILHAKPPNPYESCTCDACGLRRDYMIYHCSLCDFNIDLYCSSLPYTLKNYGGHEHTLQLWAKKSTFCCDACVQTHSEPGISYFCATCRIRIHQECAILPSSTNHAKHSHPLKLIYFDPLEYSRYRPSCKRCSREILNKSWIYGCKECRYLVHSKCFPPHSHLEDLSRLEEIEGKYKDNAANMLHLPIAEKDMDWISIMFKQASLARKTDAAEDANIFDHEHGLTLSYDEEEKRNEFCNGCSHPISTPFYSCNHCKLFLHKWCAELPLEMEPRNYTYEGHKHSVKLIPKAPTLSGLFNCGICFKYCNGFAYTCVIENCEENTLLDIKCATYPTHVKHEAHPHMLDLQLNLFDPCQCCSKTIMGLNFICPPCGFTIDPQCASLPHSVWHRYDKEHPFILTYPDNIDPLEEYVCEFCEEDISGSFWFYHCAICDHSIHIKCLCKVEDEYSNLRMGVTLNFPIHQHPLTLTKKLESRPPCNHCGVYFEGPAFACNDCEDYYLHPGYPECSIN